MSLGSTLKKAFGFVAGILIAGVKPALVDAGHDLQQHFADLYGAAAQKLAEQLKLDTTGMTGPDKVFYILKALIATAKSQGFKGDETVLSYWLLDLAQTAYRATLPDAESELTTLIASLHLGAPLQAVVDLILPTVEQKVEGVVAGALGISPAA